MILFHRPFCLVRFNNSIIFSCLIDRHQIKRIKTNNLTERNKQKNDWSNENNTNVNMQIGFWFAKFEMNGEYLQTT